MQKDGSLSINVQQGCKPRDKQPATSSGSKKQWQEKKKLNANPDKSSDNEYEIRVLLIAMRAINLKQKNILV